MAILIMNPTIEILALGVSLHTHNVRIEDQITMAIKINMMMLQNSMKEPKFMMVDPNAGKEIRTNPDVKKHSSLL